MAEQAATPAMTAASSALPDLGSPISPMSSAAGPSAFTRSHGAPPSSRFDDDVSSYQYSSFPHGQSPPPPSTAASGMRPFPFSHDDTERSRHAYETLASSAKAYRVALSQLSAAASTFGAALETCARLKEARTQPYPPGPYSRSGNGPPADAGSLYGSGVLLGGAGIGIGNNNATSEPSCTADVLLATSGLYYLAANQQGILAETVYRSFELPIVHELDRYRADIEAERESYAASMREASRDIRRLEKEGVKLRKPRQRDVGRMRSHLVAMTMALDTLTARQGTHAVALLDQSRDMSGVVSQAGRNLVRAEMDILDGLARKGWPGGGLDVVLDGAVDLFARSGFYDDEGSGIGSGLGGLSSMASLGGIGPVSGSSAATDLGLGLGPKLLLLGGDPASSGLAHGGSDSGDDADEDDNTTLSERRSRPRLQETEVKPEETAIEEGPDEDAAKESLLRPSQSRHGRADSLNVGYHEYQSLDSVAAEHKERSSSQQPTASSSSRSKSTGDGAGRSRGRARPFSPQRVAVDPQKDIFAETESKEQPATEETAYAGENTAPKTESVHEDTDEGVHAWREGLQG